MTKYFPLKPIYLALLVFQIYLLVFSWTMLGCAFLLFTFIFLIYQYDRETIFKTIAIVIFFLFYFLWQNHNMNVQYQRVPNHISQIKVRIDTISINGDVLSFQADASGNTYQAFYTLKNKSEKDYFQNLDNNIMIIADIKLEEAEERRHFNGFDYRQYLKRHGIYRIAKVTKIKQIRLFQHRSFFDLMFKWRRSAIVISQTFPNPMRHYMSGLLFGYLDKTFDDMSDLYSSLGSRFARNQLDFISIYRELKALSPPVGIYIEDINLNTLDTNSEFILGIMAIVAQGESEQKSASITWSVIERFKRGIPMIPTHNLLGYTKDQYGRVVIDETEAKIVRLIYDSYIEGMTASEIASTLMTNHIPTVTGLERWTSLAVYNILRNEKYKGEIIMQKTYTVDCFSHKTRKNNGEKPKYRLKNGIPSIIPESRWDLVQELLKQPRRKSKSTSEIFVPKLYIKKLKSGKLRDFVVLDPSWKSEDIHEVFK
ncbi:TPA: DUF4131 domain-containing protein [Streptococcus agalactiae]